MTDPNPRAEIEKIEESIRQLETARANGTIPAAAADASIEALSARRAVFQSQLEGSGAVAQGDGATAIGQHGIGVNGSVTSSLINTGIIYQIYQSASGPARLNEREFEGFLRNYLEWVRKAYGKARLYGLESIQTSGSQKKRELSEVFIPLSLQRFSPPSRNEVEKYAKKYEGDLYAERRAFLALVGQRREEGKPIPADLILKLGGRLAVIGGAGSGKSTLLAYLATIFAEHVLEGVPLPVELPENQPPLIPLIIPLRYRREYLRLCSESPTTVLNNIRPGTIAGFVLWYLKKRSQAIHLTDESLVEEFFDRLLLKGGCLVMLDGLDEVVSQSERGQVRAEVERLADEIYSKNIFIVTARESGYKENAVFSEDFVRLDVQSLKDEQIQTLVHNWCEQLYPDKVEIQEKDILQAIHAINARYERLNLPALVRTPLMTTMVVSVKWGETELPRERARLYEAVVKVILQAQYLDDDDQTKELINWGGAWEEQREWLSYLALEMHRSGQNGAAISEERLREILAEKLSKENLDQFIRAVRSRGGLFEERAELFQFAHLTFQEFLAARLLAKDREKSFPGLEKHIPDAWWREVLLLVYGFSKQDYAPFSVDYLRWLSERDADGILRLAGLELAGSAVLELERPDANLSVGQAERLVNGLLTPGLIAPAQLRVQAGNTLAQLGDPRFDPNYWHLPADSLFGFVRIPMGVFLMGSTEQDGQASEDEEPQHEISLPDFWAAKYPITVAQFQSFVTSTNHPFDRWQRNSNPNHPVVEVSWYDAIEYAKWLTLQLRELAGKKVEAGEQDQFWVGMSQEQLQVTLPSEAEWEKSARGADGRIYPWGNAFDPDMANTGATGIGSTSVVGCFSPNGQGLYDTIGNVWEWTRSLLRLRNEGGDEVYTEYNYPYNSRDGREDLHANKASPRALRGGSYYAQSGLVRCAYRSRSLPEGWDRYLGFRVVISSIDVDKMDLK